MSRFAHDIPDDDDDQPARPATENEDDSPLFTDLSQWLDGTATQELPTVAEAWEGRCLFYSGRLNEIHAEPGTGKTNILMAAAIAVLDSGGAVVFIDPEDTPGGCTGRMRSLGASVASMRERFYYLHDPEAKDLMRAQKWAREHRPELVILDGFADAMAARGANEDKALDVLQFFRSTLRPFAEAGAAVVIADHVTKSSESRGQFARGSGAKAGRYDGVSYEVVAGKPYTPKQAGFVKLKIAKDRNGGAGPRGKIVAELHFIPGDDGKTQATFHAPAEQPEGPFRPTAIMEKIRQHLATFKTASKRTLRDIGKHEWVDQSIAIMLQEGEIQVEQKGQSHIFSLKERQT